MTHAALDAGLAALIESRTGPVRGANRTERGFTSDYTGILDTDDGALFVKAVRLDGHTVSSLEREAAINPAVRHMAPALLWQARDSEWLVLGFGYVPDAHHADFKPGSPDLPAVAAAIDRIGAIPLSDAARDWPEIRYDRYARDGAGALFTGQTLLHGDINPDNLLVGPSGDVMLVDWAWPTHGAAFIDPACLAVQLIAAGHTPAQAEEWAARCAGWRDADPDAIDAFAIATVRMYRRFERLDPEPWRKAMTTAALAWAEHRDI